MRKEMSRAPLSFPGIHPLSQMKTAINTHRQSGDQPGKPEGCESVRCPDHRDPTPEGTCWGSHSCLVKPIAFPKTVWRALCCAPHQRQQCFCSPRSRQSGFNLDELKVSSLVCVFVSAGQKILHHRSDVLETVVLINPSDEAVSTEVNMWLGGSGSGGSPADWRAGAGGAGERPKRERSSGPRGASLPQAVAGAVSVPL